MCAIFGIIGSSNAGLLKKMSKCQLYRGPDKQNFFTDKKFKLSMGMNRLSVIDKKKGNQPMFSHDKRHVIVFNGAIYNFKDLKKHLENKITFYTNSDTEVLINSYNYWGKKCFNYFDGMWAVAIYDFKTKTTTLSRDYVGQKPLFYNQNKDHLIFSSQINGIFQINKNFIFSKKNALEYFRFNHYPSPLTGYDNLFQVSPGEVLEFKKKKIFKKQYWDIQKGGNYNIFFKKNNSSSISKLFMNIIKNFSIADEKVGICLSPGLDSQLIKLRLEKLQKKIKSFTIGFKEKTYDESRYIKSTKVNKNYKKILHKEDFQLIFNNIKKEIYFPFGDASLIALANALLILAKSCSDAVALSWLASHKNTSAFSASDNHTMPSLILRDSGDMIFLAMPFLFALPVLSYIQPKSAAANASRVASVPSTPSMAVAYSLARATISDAAARTALVLRVAVAWKSFLIMQDIM